MNSPFISHIRIKNFRNFKDTEVELRHKQVIIGENNAGKTNFLRAIQLIFDKGYSDFDRDLNESDFHDSIKNPKKNGEEILIEVEIQNYEHNRHLVANFQDAVVATEPPTLRITYKYYPLKDADEKIFGYKHKIFKGKNEDILFRSEDRNFLNVSVIGALRDVERELKGNKQSLLYKLVKQYKISEEDLEEISEAIREASKEVTNLDEIIDIKSAIQSRFDSLSGLQRDNEINLQPYEIDTERLLYSIQVYLGIKERPVSELSLGLANILYVAIMMLLLRDKTIPRILQKDDYLSYLEMDNNDLLIGNYTISENGKKYIINSEISSEEDLKLYEFFNKNTSSQLGTTILAVEEPEAHLHPSLQRLIYREVLQDSDTSVIFTTHSPFITSVAPLNTIVHVKTKGNLSTLFSTATMTLDPIEENDLERYLDAKRGEIYFGKGILFVEGITEEYVISRTADLMEVPLDSLGIVICNVNSTNFRPYIQLVSNLGIPWSLVTDGDYYEIETIQGKDGKEKKSKVYHRLKTGDALHNFRSLEILLKMAVDFELLSEEEIPIDEYSDQISLLKEVGCHVGTYTLEVDSMVGADQDGIKIYKQVYSEVRPGGKNQQKNFENDIDKGRFWNALQKIENNIGKGRFAQRLSSHLTLNLVPEYIQNAIDDIVLKVNTDNE